MTDIDQGAAIAKACGWVGIYVEAGEIYGKSPKDQIACRQEGSILLDYLKDLNAMHSAEQSIALTERAEYMNRLRQITQVGRMATCDWTSSTASAKHRAEAFLKTKKLWKK